MVEVQPFSAVVLDMIAPASFAIVAVNPWTAVPTYLLAGLTGLAILAGG